MFFSLRVRLMALGLLVIAPLVALLLHSAAEERRAAYAEAEKNLLRLTRIISRDQEQIVRATRQLLLVLARLPSVRNGDAKACNELFPQLIRDHSTYANFGVIRTDGYVNCSSVPIDRPIYVGDRYYFKQALQTRDFVVGEHQIDRITKNPSIHFGYPVLDDAGVVRSLVYAALDLRWLNRLAVDGHLPQSAVIQMVHRNGKVWIHYPKPQNSEVKAISQNRIAEAILAKRGDGSFTATGGDGISRLYAFHPFSGVGENEAYLAIGISTKDLFSKADEGLRYNMIAIAILSLVALGMAWMGVGLLVLRSTHTLMETTKRIAGGDLTARTGLPHGKGELAQLAKSFDMMAETLQAREIESQSAAKEIRKLNEDLDRRVRERTAQLEATNRELESFSYSVSHDLRAPLRSIHGFSHALFEDYSDQLDGQGKDYLTRIIAAGQHMSLLIDDLLELARVTRSELHGEVVNLTTLARSVAAELTNSRNQRRVEFCIAEGLMTYGDQRLLRVALENLFGNAWKFTAKASQAKIEFGIYASNGRPSYFVRDNGAGFNMAYADKLFRPFQRLHDTADFDGTGIGLATVQRVIHRHGGHIWAESSEGKGATFFFTL